MICHVIYCICGCFMNDFCSSYQLKMTQNQNMKTRENKMNLVIIMNKKSHYIYMIMSSISILILIISITFFYVNHFIQQQSLYHKLILTCSDHSSIMSIIFNITIIIIKTRLHVLYYIILH